jgi:putative DNA primase/helicase
MAADGDAWKERVFRTYLKGGGKDGKSCVDRHKGIPHVRTFQEASKFPCFGGVLQEGFIDISFDDPKMSEAFLNMADAMGWRCLALENPANKHLHTIWRDPQSKIRKFTKDLPLAVGLVADIHGGETYIPLRVNGTDRYPPVYDVLDDEDYQEVPRELLPVATKIKLWGSAEGDGRNSDMYSYILVLQSQLGMDDDEIREMYRNCINPFILRDKLPDDELEIILRAESFEKRPLPVFWDKGAFLHNRFALYLRDEQDVVIVNGRLHIYKDGVYVGARRDLESRMIQIEPRLKDAHRREVLKYLDILCEEKKASDPRYIAFANGIYDVAEDVLLPFSRDLVVTNKLPWDYQAGAYDALTDKVLDNLSCKDRAIRAVLEECIGACMYRSALLAGGKSFILTGDKSNGKSTFLDMIKFFLGDENVSSLDLKEIGDRFSTAMIAGKLANIGDDIGDDFLQGSQVSIFKKVVTGNRIKAEHKGLEPFDLDPYCKLLFSANEIPRMKDKTGAVMRRLVIVPFNAKFSKTDPDFDPFITKKLMQRGAMEYLAVLGIAGLKRVLTERQFTVSEKVQQELDEYELENNPILGFIAEAGTENIINQATGDVYRRYQVYCQDTSTIQMSQVVFSKQLCKRLGLKSVQRKIDGKNHRCFIKE